MYHKNKKETQAYRKENGLCIKCGVKVERHLLCDVHKKEYNAEKKKKYNPTTKKEYYHKNKESILKAHSKYVKRKYKEDPQFRLRRNILSRVQDIMKTTNGDKKYSISKNMGCTFHELKQHLENEFYQNEKTWEYMSWENYGINGWHIDHVIPLSFFNLQDPTQFKLANHYTNLRPIWAEENIKKSDSLDSDSFLHTIQCDDGFYIIEAYNDEDAV